MTCQDILGRPPFLPWIIGSAATGNIYFYAGRGTVPGFTQVYYMPSSIPVRPASGRETPVMVRYEVHGYQVLVSTL